MSLPSLWCLYVAPIGPRGVAARAMGPSHITPSGPVTSTSRHYHHFLGCPNVAMSGILEFLQREMQVVMATLDLFASPAVFY